MSNIKAEQLKSLWEKEKEAYKFKEVGSGTALFVKKLLECPTIFNLKEGNLSTSLEKRKNEFIHEQATKEGRQADFVIFIDSEIRIPVEVEKYTHLESGIIQIKLYQKDLDKKYGILTDGFSWRFYYNNIFISFDLNDMLDRTDSFLDFWSDYIKAENYYLTFFENRGQQKLFIEDEVLFVEKYKILFFDDVTHLIKSFKNKLEIEGYINISDKIEREKRATEITYAYIIQFILFKTLVDNKFDDFEEEFDEICLNIYNFIKAKSFKNILGILDSISAKISGNIYKPFAYEQELIDKKIRKLFQTPENLLHEVAPWLDIFVFIKKYNFQNIQNEIFGFIYENYLKVLYADENKGQYFTDPNVVNFMLEQVGFTKKYIKECIENNQLDKLSFIDPSCGSGTFLYSATDKIIEGSKSCYDDRQIQQVAINNIFGLDIAEFPLYLAEMNILMKLLPYVINHDHEKPIVDKIQVFWTKDSIAEFIDSGIFASGQISLNGYTVKPELSSYVRDENDLKEMKNSMGIIPRRRFDFVVGNPPYISYNECSEQNIEIFQLMKKKKVNLNNIYGVNLHSVPNNPKRYRPNPNLYAFFIALGFALLKEGAKICYIVPQTLLFAGDLDVLRYYLSKKTTIEKIILFNGHVFVGRGLNQKDKVPTSSLIFVARRAKPAQDHQIEIIHYLRKDDDVEKIMKNIAEKKYTDKKTILQTELLSDIASWNYLFKKDADIKFIKLYKNLGEEISVYYEHSKALARFNSNFYFDSGYSIDEKQVLPELPENTKYFRFPKINEDYWSIHNFLGFWPDIRKGKGKLIIRLRQANQRYNLLDSKYKIVWSYQNPERFHYTGLPVIWARNRYCSIGSANKKEVFYLLALLNSGITKKVLDLNLRTEAEKSFLVSTTAIKEYIRIPIITEKNMRIKEKIIQLCEELLNLEDKKLSDYVNLSKVSIQEIDNIFVSNEKLFLYVGKNKLQLEIKDKAKEIKSTIIRAFFDEESTQQKLIDIKKPKIKITLNLLKNLPILDKPKIDVLLDSINLLFFALYLDIPIDKFELGKLRKKLCKEKYYNLFFR